MRRDHELGVTEIRKTVYISRATFYRYLAAANEPTPSALITGNQSNVLGEVT